jgi:hypothetical protein
MRYGISSASLLFLFVSLNAEKAFAVESLLLREIASGKALAMTGSSKSLQRKARRW